MSAKQIAWVLLGTMILAGCATMSDEKWARARAARVRIVNNADVVRGCQPIGSVTDDDMQDLQKKAARLGGDVALVTLQSQGARGAFGTYGGGFRVRTYTTAEVYRCGGGPPEPQGSKAAIVRDFVECQQGIDDSHSLDRLTDPDVAEPKFQRLMSNCLSDRGWNVPGLAAHAHPRVTEADLQRTGVMRDLEECGQGTRADATSTNMRACLRSRGWVLE